MILRRGPTNHVALIAWDRQTDTFELGQWFAGRVYERRCDLSPDGKYFVYFAGDYKPPLRTWTAVSRPPYFTALGLWPKGDSYGGGGLFEGPLDLAINHHPSNLELHETCEPVPSKLTITSREPKRRHGKPLSLYGERLLRDGWVQTNQGNAIENADDAPIWIEYDPPITFTRTNPRASDVVLTMKIVGQRERNGPWWLVEYDVHRQHTSQLLQLGRTDWAQWDTNGDLLYSQEGRLFRHSASDLFDASPTQLADFTTHRFRTLSPPDDYGWS